MSFCGDYVKVLSGFCCDSFGFCRDLIENQSRFLYSSRRLGEFVSEIATTEIVIHFFSEAFGLIVVVVHFYGDSRRILG